MNQATSANTKPIRVRPATREKFERISRLNRWSLVETADALADDFLSRHSPAASVPQGEAKPESGTSNAA